MESEVFEVQMIEIGPVVEDVQREGRYVRVVRAVLRDGTEREWQLTGPSWAVRVRWVGGRSRKLSGAQNRQRGRVEERYGRGDYAVARGPCPEAYLLYEWCERQ